jgi:hypothetical protein
MRRSATPEELDLKKRVARHNCKLRRRGDLYTLIPSDGEGSVEGSFENIESWIRTVLEDRREIHITTACGMPLYTINGAEAVVIE